jgi:hypothetical protein
VKFENQSQAGLEHHSDIIFFGFFLHVNPGFSAFYGIFKEVRQFSGRTLQHDDMTIYDLRKLVELAMLEHIESEDITWLTILP